MSNCSNLVCANTYMYTHTALNLLILKFQLYLLLVSLYSILMNLLQLLDI